MIFLIVNLSPRWTVGFNKLEIMVLKLKVKSDLIQVLAIVGNKTDKT